MKSMRELISLIENVDQFSEADETHQDYDERMRRLAANYRELLSDPAKALYVARMSRIPGWKDQMEIALEYVKNNPVNEKSTSEKQARFMAAAAHNPAFAKKVGIDQGVAKEFNKADTGTEQLSNAMKKECSINEWDEDPEERRTNRKEGLDATIEFYLRKVGVNTTSPIDRNDAINIAQKIENESVGEYGLPAIDSDEVLTYMNERNMIIDDNESWNDIGSEFDPKLGEAHVDSCRQTNPASANKACAMEGEDMFDQSKVDDALAQFQRLVDNFVEPEDALEIVLSNCEDIGCSGDEIASISDAIMSVFGMEDDPGEPDGANDFSDDADVLKSAGWGSDEDYGGDDFPMEDLNNGYYDRESMSGNDFFPNGADGPVVNAVGPSGARQGDNPEQKKMQVAEVHKELVYGYRNFLKESDAKKKS